MTDDANTPDDALDKTLHDTEAAVGQALESILNSRAGLDQIRQRIRDTPPRDHAAAPAGQPTQEERAAETGVAPSQASDRRRHARFKPRVSRTKAKILLVDDRPENLLALEAILSPLDQTLVRASSGEEALKALLVDNFAVILLDVQMPGMDGFETATLIKRREVARDIPIIFLSAINHGPLNTFRGYAARAVDFVSKPFEPWALRAKVSVFIELHMKNVQLQEQAALLRLQLDGSSGVASSALLAEFSSILAAVEEEAEGIGKELNEMSTGEARSVTTEHLERRIRRLRQIVDALEHRDSASATAFPPLG